MVRQPHRGASKLAADLSANAGRVSPRNLGEHFRRQLPDAAEEAAVAAVDSIVSSGGKTLYKKYLDRKQYPFTVDAAVEAAVSHVNMCFVTHDETDARSEWEIETEPGMADTDSWIRKHVNIRCAEAESAAWAKPRRSLEMEAEKMPPGLRKRALTAKRLSNFGVENIPEGFNWLEASDPEDRMLGKIGPVLPRSFPIQDDHEPPDQVEEELRRAKSEKANPRNKAAQVVIRTPEEDEERERQRRKLDELDRRPHTFDSQGRVLWVQALVPDTLPQFQEGPLEYNLVNKRLAETSGKLATTRAAVRPVTAPAKPVTKQQVRKREKPHVFTDGFHRLPGAQPPLLDTIKLKPGVLLECDGRRAGNISHSGDRMSWQEYRALTEAGKAGREDASPSKEGKVVSPSSAASLLAVSASASPSATNAAAMRQLPKAQPQSPQAKEASSLSQEPQGPVVSTPQRRATSARAGHQPRTHRVQVLGNPSLSRVPTAPPVGATMGHGGLFLDASKKDSLFYPLADAPGTRAGILKCGPARNAKIGRVPARCRSAGALRR